MIPEWAFLTSQKSLIKHVPEKKIEYLKYDPKKWQKYFGILNPKLQLTNIGAYSIARPQMRQQLLDFIQKIVGSTKNLIVTETHGGLGGFTINLANGFKKVQSVEIEKMHADIIKNNCNILGKKNVAVYNKDFMDIYPDLKQDVIVCDPPWGGPDYYERESVCLGLNNVNIVYFINKLADEKKFKLFVLLAPSNYDFNNFIGHLDPKYLSSVHVEYADPNHPHHFFISILI